MNYYETLGVPRTASAAEIKAAYRQLARQWHPDNNMDNLDEATKRFQEISNAYEHLKDAGKRRRYDDMLDSNPSADEQSRYYDREPAFDADQTFFEEFKEIFVAVLQELAAQGDISSGVVGKSVSAAGWAGAGAVAGAVVAAIVFAPAVIPAGLAMGGLGAIKGWTGNDMVTVYQNLTPELKSKVLKMVLKAAAKIAA